MKAQTPVPSNNPLAADLAWVRELMDERDRRYDERFRELQATAVATEKARDKAIETAMAAHREITEVSFRATQVAIDKAEQAQKEYNIRSNEFRGQLDDQANTLMPRTEAEVASKSLREMIDRIRDESRITGDRVRDEARLMVDRARDEARMMVEAVKEQVVHLQKSQSESAGRRDYSVPLLMTIASVVVGLIVFFVQRSIDRPKDVVREIVPPSQTTGTIK